MVVLPPYVALPVAFRDAVLGLTCCSKLRAPLEAPLEAVTPGAVVSLRHRTGYTRGGIGGIGRAPST